MVTYEFICDTCGHVDTVSAPMSKGPPPYTVCLEHGSTRRLYNGQSQSIVYLGAPEYIEKAYRGEEKVPGLTTAAVRGIVNNEVIRKNKGRQNARLRTRRTIVS